MSDLDTIAAGLISTPSAPPAPTGDQGAPPPVEPTLSEQETPNADSPQEQGAEDQDSTDLFEAAGEAPQEDAGSEEEEEPIFEVTVDGETREVTLADLRATYSGEGAIAKRIQEATEARNEAQQARDIAVAQYREEAKSVFEQEVNALRQQTAQLAKVYTTYGDQMLQPQVQPPDPAIRESDPIGYLTQEAEYRRDQDRLQQQKQHMTEVVTAAQQQKTEQQRVFASQQLNSMIKEVPAMADPKYRESQVSRMFEVGQAIGFQDQEIKEYLPDRRVAYLFMLAAEGASHIINAASGGVQEMVKQKAKPLPVTQVRKVSRSSKKRKAVTETARRTGSIDDVAQSLIVPRG